LTSNGEIYVFNEKVAKNDLSAKLTEISKDQKDKLVVLRADKSIAIQEVIDVMDIARATGLTRFVVATQLR
jgi:biopolymer transport protein ExbD